MITHMVKHGRNGTITIIREEGDKKVYNDSTLMRHIARKLNEMGYNVVKKLMWRDGHMVDDNLTYIKTKRTDEQSFFIYDGAYNIRSAYKDYNEGELILNMCFDYAKP